MAYLGSGMEEVEKTVATCNMVCDTMTGNGSLTTMTIGASQEMPGHVNNVSIYFDGVAQRPATDYTLAGKTVTFTTAPENGVKVVCLSYASEYLDVISDATVYGSEILDGAITDAKIASGIAASKLTGALPSIDGSAVTNFGAKAVVKNASNPATNTNPSGGVGTIWANTTSGEMYVLTDATAGDNVWTNIGSGEGDVPIQHRTIAGYASGGHANVPSGVNTSLISRYSFTSDGNATTHGDLTSDKQVSESGTSSTTHGFVAGGSPEQNNIDKFAFASNTTAAGHGVLTRTTHSGAGSYSSTDGFHAGGEGPNNTVINKFSFASNTTASSHGNIRGSLGLLAGHSSETHGFISGGGPPDSNQIDKYAFASNTTSADHGDLETAYNQVCGTMSSTDGYTSGGHPDTNKIQKFAFSSNTTASDHGNLTRAIRLSSGQSSTTHGYNTGGGEPARSNVIEKFAFGSSSNATDVGDLTIVVSYQAGHEQ